MRDDEREPDIQLLRDSQAPLAYFRRYFCSSMNFNIFCQRSFAQLDDTGATSVKLCSCQATPDTQTQDITEQCTDCSEIGNSELFPPNPSDRKLSFRPPILPTQDSVESGETVKEPYKREATGSQVPIAGALFIATCVGSPVTALAGLKLGMFAAVGGAIMGFATGKMFAEHE